MGPISNRRPGGSDGAEPLSAQSSAFDAIGSFPRPTDLVDAEALADMRAFNDLKAKRKKQRKRKIVVGIVSAVAVLAVAGGAFAWYSADQAAKALENMAPQTAFVEQGTFVETVSASGNLQPVASVSATSEVDGIVGEVLVAEGDAVAEGQTLFTVVNDDLDKAVKQAAQGIEEAKNGVAQAQNAVNDAYHAKSAGQQAAARAQEQAQAAAAAAKEAGAATPASDASGASFDEAGADSAIRNAELALSSANLALQNAQSAYDEAVARAAKRTVTASIAGSVVAVNIEPGKALGATANAARHCGQHRHHIGRLRRRGGWCHVRRHGRRGHVRGEAAHRRTRPAPQARHDRQGHHHHDHHRERAQGAHLGRAVRRCGRQFRHGAHRS